MVKQWPTTFSCHKLSSQPVVSFGYFVKTSHNKTFNVTLTKNVKKGLGEAWQSDRRYFTKQLHAILRTALRADHVCQFNVFISLLLNKDQVHCVHYI